MPDVAKTKTNSSSGSLLLPIPQATQTMNAHWAPGQHTIKPQGVVVAPPSGSSYMRRNETLSSSSRQQNMAEQKSSENAMFVYKTIEG